MNPDRLGRYVARSCSERSEVFVKKTYSRDIEWDRDHVKSTNVKQDAGAGVRVMGQDRIGFAHANQSRLSVPDLVERARTVRRMKSPDRARGFPGIPPDQHREVRDRFDDTLTTDPMDRIETITDRLTGALDQSEVRTLQAQFGESWSESYLYVDGRPVFTVKSSSYSFGSWTVCERDGEVESGYDGQSFDSFENLDFERVLENARDRGRELLGSSPPEEYHGRAVLTDRAASSLLGLASSMVNGESIHKQRSAWGVERLGDQVASDHVTIIDDPEVPRLTGSGEFDAYGDPMKPVTVVGDGVYRQCLTNQYVSNQLGLPNNHRTSRGFRSTPGVGTTNFQLQPGQSTFDEMLSELGEGPVITGIQPGSGMDSVNGRFSVGCHGFFRETDGTKRSFTEGTISASLEEFLSGVEAVGNTLPPGQSTASPPLLVETIHLGGSG